MGHSMKLTISEQCRFEHPPGVGPHGQNGARPGPAPQQQQQNQFGEFNRTNNQNYAPPRAPGRLTPNRRSHAVGVVLKTNSVQDNPHVTIGMAQYWNREFQCLLRTRPF